MPASFSSSELSAHQMAPSGVIAHWRSFRALEPTFHSSSEHFAVSCFCFLFKPPSSRHSCPQAWGSCCLVATFGGFRVASLVYYVRRMGSPGIAVIRRMT